MHLSHHPQQPNLLLTGGSGLLGANLLRLAPWLQAPDHQEFDLAKRTTMEAYFKRHTVESVIHAAAYTSPPWWMSAPWRPWKPTWPAPPI